MKTLRKIALVIALAVFFGGSTAAGFAWWDRLEEDQVITIPVGEGVTLSVNLDEQTTGNLVPSGVVMKTGDVTEVEVEFTVTLDKTNLLDALNLSVVADNVQIDGSSDYASLVNISISNPGTIQNSAVEVVITVTLTEPANQTEYNAIAGKAITFDVTFLASIA